MNYCKEQICWSRGYGAIVNVFVREKLMNRRGVLERVLIAFLCLFVTPVCTLAQVGPDVETWPIQGMPSDAPTPDLSGLNHKPAGLHGKIQTRDGALVFEDGTPIRFWGVNLQAYALFHTNTSAIELHAQRMARLGINLVRIHHHDSHWVQPNVFGTKPSDTLGLDPASMQKLDAWIAALKDQGIYVWLDLHVGRRFTKQDGISGFDEIAEDEGLADVRGFNYISPTIEARMIEFQGAYLSHQNAMTGLTYAEDPAVVAVMLTNENDLTHHFGNGLLPNKNVPMHNELFMALADEFARSNDLDPDETWRTWEHGDSKIFLSDLERRFNERLIPAVRDTGFEGLISTTSLWGGMTISGLPSLTVGSIIDAHSYGTGGEIGFDPRQRSGFMEWIAIAQVEGMPLSVSEWNIGEFPAEDRFITPLRVATSAAHQGWDAMMIYGYSQQSLDGPTAPNNWSMAEDPGLIWMMPASALLFREGHVRQAENSYAICLDEDEFFGRPVSPETSVAIRTVFEQSRLVTCMPQTRALPWLAATELKRDDYRLLDLDKSYLDQDATVVSADTGEFQRDFGNARFKVDTGKSQIVAGSFQDETIETRDVVFEITTPMAAVAVQSLEGNEIAQSGRILISISGRSVPVEANAADFRVEPVTGTLQIKAPAGLMLRSADQNAALPSNAHHYDGGRHVIDLAEIKGARWLYLEQAQ
ncbi:cellulase family glycosylhydrolase [uncultured Ruegeria sp.]|uniref:cellulase family glycosylhydrolase n=1 Tax=uncultured Ruegeria sp. TaxID=259304 RepID=UPI002627B8E3|nr:cellulase family glycosylhydrolase [uncultured Ruegeria sp.]